MNRLLTRIALLALIAAGPAQSLHAQVSARGVLGAGGTGATNGTITVNATVAQSVIGSVGSPLSALQGFWYSLTPPSPTSVREEYVAGNGSSALDCVPNPFSTQAVIRVRVDRSGPVSLRLYDALGREVAALVDGPRDAGTIAVTIDADDLPSGNYIAQLVAGGTRQMIRVMVSR